MKTSLWMHNGVSVADAAAALGTSKSTVFRMIKRHRIGYEWRHYCDGSTRLVVDGDVIDAMINRQ